MAKRKLNKQLNRNRHVVMVVTLLSVAALFLVVVSVARKNLQPERVEKKVSVGSNQPKPTHDASKEVQLSGAETVALHKAVYDAVVESSGGEVPTYFQFEYTRLDSVVSTGVWAKGGFITTNTTDAGAKGFLAHKLSDGWDVGILGDEKYGELWQQTPEDFYPSIREHYLNN